MAEDLLDTVGQLFGPIRGGVAFAVVLVGALLAATTGVVAASVIAMGLISLPVMQRYNYDPSVATGTIAAAGTLAQIVPPSLVLIVMADQLGVSVGDMYLGAVYPALLTIGAYCLYILALTILRPSAVPALPPEERRLGNGVWSLVAVMALAAILYVVGTRVIFADLIPATRVVFAATLATVVAYGVALANRHLKLGVLSYLTEQVVIVLIPPLALIFLVLGTIFLGIATPTEGGAMGAVGALLLAFAKGRIDRKVLTSAVEATAKLSAFVLFILIGARVFGLTFYGVNGQVWLEELLLSLPGGQFGFLLVVTVVIFVLGCFLDFFEIAFILVPLLAPVAETLGIDLIWFGVLLSMNLQTSFLTPPFGFALFYLRSVAPTEEWTDKQTGETMPPIRTSQVYKGVLPYIAMNFALILVVILIPGFVTHYDDARQERAAQSRSEAPASSSDTGSGGGTSGGSFNFGGSGGGTTDSSDGNSSGGFNFGGGGGDSAPAEPAPGGGSSGGGFNFGGEGNSAPAPQEAAPGGNASTGQGFNFGGGESAAPDQENAPDSAGDAPSGDTPDESGDMPDEEAPASDTGGGGGFNFN